MFFLVNVRWVRVCFIGFLGGFFSCRICSGWVEWEWFWFEDSECWEEKVLCGLDGGSFVRCC